MRVGRHEGIRDLCSLLYSGGLLTEFLPLLDCTFFVLTFPALRLTFPLRFLRVFRLLHTFSKGLSSSSKSSACVKLFWFFLLSYHPASRRAHPPLILNFLPIVSSPAPLCLPAKPCKCPETAPPPPGGGSRREKGEPLCRGTLVQWHIRGDVAVK